MAVELSGGADEAETIGLSIIAAAFYSVWKVSNNIRNCSNRRSGLAHLYVFCKGGDRAVRHLLTATELDRPRAELLELNGLERYERPLPQMTEYDQLLGISAAAAEVAR
jgi:hypothetical protein